MDGAALGGAVLEDSGDSEIPEGVYVVDVVGASPDEPKNKGSALTVASTSSPILPLSRHAQAT